MKKFFLISMIASLFTSMSATLMSQMIEDETLLLNSFSENSHETTLDSEMESLISEKSPIVDEPESRLEHEEIFVEEVITQETIVVSGNNWRLTSSGTLEIFGGLVIGTSLNNGPSWKNYKSDVVRMVFTEPTVIQSKVDVFDQYPNLVEIIGLELCDISPLTDLSYMFMNNPSLERLDLSNFDTKNVNSMRSMFSGCSSLTQLDLSHFDTSNVTSMHSMFSGCTSLTKLDLSSASSQKLTAFGSNYIFGLPSSQGSAAPITHLILNQDFKLTEVMQFRFWSDELNWFDQNNVKILKTKDLINYHNSSDTTNIFRHGPSFFLDFETNGGTPINSQELLAGEKWTEPDIPQKEGYVFSGWYTEAHFITRFDFEKEVTESVTVYAKWEKVTLETRELNVPVGTRQDLLSPDHFIHTLKIGDIVLSPSEYTVEQLEKVDTNIIKNESVPLQISLNNDEWNQVLSTQGQINIVWSSTIVSRAANMISYPLDVAVSLLISEEGPYLIANEGDGLSSTSTLQSIPELAVLRGTSDDILLDLRGTSMNQPPISLMRTWNQAFDESTFQYGDVLEYSSSSTNGANYQGRNSWISRNELLVRESTGYPVVYYELTETEGYRLLRLNQLEVKNGVKVPVGMTIEEMNQRIEDFIEIPTQITNPEIFTFAVKEMDDTNTGGTSKKAIINVSEKLLSGGTFTMTYEVSFVVPQSIQEIFLDEDGDEIKEKVITEFENGALFTPHPENYITSNGLLYRYVGWKNTMDGDINSGKPPSTTQETTYIYLYELADQLIQVTLPTVMVFGTYDQTDKIQSKSYELVNHSKQIGTEIILDRFEENSSEIEFLDVEEADPTHEKIAARLNLLVEDELQIASLNQRTSQQSVVTLTPEEITTICFSGNYYGDFSQSYKADYNMKLLFKPIEGK